METNSLHSRFQVDFSYAVHFTEDVFCPENDLLASVLPPDSTHRVLMVVDSGVAEAFPVLRTQIEQWFAAHSDRADLVAAPVVFPGGEEAKNNYRHIMSLVDLMLEHHLCRHSFVVVIGGGAVLDAAGFAAAMVHRGLRMIRLPSTTLAQNDAGIGVKNGMNLHGVKNSVGVFAPPFAVLNDAKLLQGLPTEVWRDGIAEAFKVAMIKDAEFFHELVELSPRLGDRDPQAMNRLIHRCADLHMQHIASGGDPFETGSARPLDFGHWSAHKLESMSRSRIRHGEAVATGIALDTAYAVRLGWVDSAVHKTLVRALQTCGFDLAPPELGLQLGDGSFMVLQGLEDFREHLGGRLTLSLPGPLGSRREVNEVKLDWMSEEIEKSLRLSCS